MPRILILEDDRATAMMLSIFIKALGHDATIAHDGTAGFDVLRTQPHDVIISDVLMAPMDGIEFITQLRAMRDSTPVVMFSGGTTAEAVAQARKAGATDFLSKPMKLEEIRRCIDHALALKRVDLTLDPAQADAAPNRRSQDTGELADLLPGASYAAVRKSLALVAHRPRALLEAEVGMAHHELLEFIHRSGPACHGPLVIHHLGKASMEDILAGLLDEKLLPGTWFRVAAKGTLVLVAIEHLPLPVQKNLNAALRKYSGGHLIVTTQSDPELLVAQGRLDEGLYFRLSTFSLRLPPVRECESDVVSLFQSCLAVSPGFVFGSVDIQIEEPVARALRTYAWPENISEMRQVAASTAARLRTPQVTMAQLPERFFKVRMPTLADALLTAQTEHILRAQRIFGAPLEVAEMLGVSAQQVEAVAAGAREPLFHFATSVSLESQPPMAVAAAPATAPSSPASNRVLLVVREPVLRAAAAASIPARGLRVRTSRDGLGALATVANRPESYGNVILVGSDALFTPDEFAGQLRRLAPAVKFAALAEHTVGEPLGLAEIEDALAHLLLHAS